MTCIMLGVLVRAAFEIHRAEDARRMATRRSVPARPASAGAGVGELPLAARVKVEAALQKVRA
jgi:hypothetical protein